MSVCRTDGPLLSFMSLAERMGVLDTTALPVTCSDVYVIDV